MAETVHKAPVTRNYFETFMAKDHVMDLVGSSCKVSNAVLHDNDLSVSSAAEMHQFCESRLTEVGESSYVSPKSKYKASSRSFKLIERVAHTCITRAKTLPGSRKLHSVSSTGVGFQIKVRELSCYCVCLFVLRFYGPVNPMGSCRARSVYLTTRLLGRLSPLSG